MTYSNEDYVQDLKKIFMNPEGERVIKYLYSTEVATSSYSVGTPIEAVMYNAGRKDFIQQLIDDVKTIEETFNIFYK